MKHNTLAKGTTRAAKSLCGGVVLIPDSDYIISGFPGSSV